MFAEQFLPLVTERLILRRFVDLDLKPFLAYRQDPQVARFQGWSMLSLAEAQCFISEMQTAPIGMPGEWFQIAIAHRQSNLLLGDIGMQVYRENPAVVEIGFTLGRGAQGQGYAKEAVQGLIDALFQLGTIGKVVGITDMRNEPSIRLLQRLGMTLVRSDEVLFKGEWCVEQTFELAREKWSLVQASGAI
ncbi:GNAT family N-acetyltransferase [Thermoleptolyngbya oregonensis NK1-22]|uniref:GNAT family N-acetyltransferase n=1 Tax=Thermoleptolyngbya oregonensis NK1-22 TaxID=2547457 RepID=A0AA96YLU5_9CYAN|nr:GNAT family N-acetyltransferase [Thermoleptolyngbya oregonensis]WOB42547.1 GNAT family N-acetyltransferase [Thermoleptolyngbya oregonensis NK1-22]